MNTKKPRRVDLLAVALALLAITLIVYGAYQSTRSADSGIPLFIIGLAFCGLAALRASPQ